MADLYSQAQQEVDAQIAARRAAVDAQKRSAENAYLEAKRQWETGRQAALGTLTGNQADERARNANRMAARGIGVGEGALVNYGRLNASHEGQLAEVERGYADTLGEMNVNYQNRLGEADATIAAAQAEREALVQQLYRELSQQRAATSRSYGGGGGGGSRSASSGGYTIDDALAIARAGGYTWSEQNALLDALYVPVAQRWGYIGANPADIEPDSLAGQTLTTSKKKFIGNHVKR